MISIVLPLFNPPPNWENIIAENHEEIKNEIGENLELILVNDGSKSSLSEQLDSLKYSIPSLKYIEYEQNMGKGYALRKGVREAEGDIIIYTDTDFPYTTASFLAVYKKLKAGTDIAIGIKDKSYYRNVPLVRKVISKVLRRLIGFFLSMPITDTQCGLKGFLSSHRHIFLDTKINRYLFDLEFVYKCYRQKTRLKVEPVVIQLKPGIFFRRMNSKILVTELRNFLTIIINRKKPV